MDDSEVRRLLARTRSDTAARLAEMTGERLALNAAASDSNLDDEHDPEGSTVAFERAQLSALITQAAARLQDVDSALDRLSAGTYGRCEVCGNPIGEERLAAVPVAQLCVRCAARPR